MNKERAVISLLSAIVVILFMILVSGKEPEPTQVKQYTTETFPNEQVTTQPVPLDLDSIVKRGRLVALTRYNANSFFLYRGQPMGYEYELLKLFADELGVELEIKIPSTRDSLFVMLNNGEGDLIAANMTITKERSERVDFSYHHNTTRQVLIQKKPDNWRRLKRHITEKQLIRDPLELLGKTIAVRKGSNYHQRINNLMLEMGGEIFIDTMDDSYETEELIKMVNDGDVKYTIADENIAQVNSVSYPNLDMETAVSFSQRVAWAFRKSSPKLRDAADSWMEKLRAGNSPTYYVIYNKYYKNNLRFKKRKESQFYSLETGTISPYDTYFKQYAHDPMFPWTLIAAQAYQESRFDPTTTSWAGAVGLMQLLPKTAEDMGITNSEDPVQSIHAGVKYLRYVHKHFWTDLPDEEAVKFVLASYNAGVGHVKDAQRLAKELGMDPNKWDDNVELAILKLSDKHYFYNPVVKHGFCRGEEPHNYVRDIFARKKIYDGILVQAEAQKRREQDSLELSDTTEAPKEAI